MAFKIKEFDCNIFGDFKVGDNTCYNAHLFCDLVTQNEGGRFNKPIILQAASLVEVAFAQIFYRARNYNREGVPNISEEDRQKISEKQIDKLAIIIDNLKKYSILDRMGDDIYKELHILRKYRNKIHIQGELEIDNSPRDEANQFIDSKVAWAIDLTWRVYAYLEQYYPRPEYIRGHVRPLSLPCIE